MSDEPETKKIKLEDCKSEPVESNLTVSDSNADVQESAQKLSSQSEKDVGIIEYISKSSPIFGILKQRYNFCLLFSHILIISYPNFLFNKKRILIFLLLCY